MSGIDKIHTGFRMVYDAIKTDGFTLIELKGVVMLCDKLKEATEKVITRAEKENNQVGG